MDHVGFTILIIVFLMIMGKPVLSSFPDGISLKII